MKEAVTAPLAAGWNKFGRHLFMHLYFQPDDIRLERPKHVVEK